MTEKQVFEGVVKHTSNGIEGGPIIIDEKGIDQWRKLDDALYDLYGKHIRVTLEIIAESDSQVEGDTH